MHKNKVNIFRFKRLPISKSNILSELEIHTFERKGDMFQRYRKPRLLRIYGGSNQDLKLGSCCSFAEHSAFSK